MEQLSGIRGAEIRVLGPSGMEDFHAHLMRLDRHSRFPALDDPSIDAHCLDLISKCAILVGIYVDGVMRAGAEIVPDRTARRAQASITVETGFHERLFERDLTARVLDEARRYHLNELRVLAASDTRTYKVPVLEVAAYAANG